jgi:hypothetical protein
VLRSQLNQKYFVERVPAGRINVFRFYQDQSERQIEDPAFSDMLLNVRITVDGREQTAHVTFRKGCIFSLEFKKPGDFYDGKSLTVLDVKPGTPSQTYTRAIDRMEHGADDNGGENRHRSGM